DLGRAVAEGRKVLIEGIGELIEHRADVVVIRTLRDGISGESGKHMASDGVLRLGGEPASIDLGGLRVATQPAQDLGEGVVCRNVAWIDVDGLAQAVGGCLGVSLLPLAHAQVVPRDGQIRGQLGRPSEGGLGALVVVACHQHVSEIDAGVRIVRVRLHGALQKLDRAVRLALMKVQQAEKIQRVGVVRLPLQYVPVTRLGLPEAARLVGGKGALQSCVGSCHVLVRCAAGRCSTHTGEVETWDHEYGLDAMNGSESPRPESPAFNRSSRPCRWTPPHGWSTSTTRRVCNTTRASPARSSTVS